MRKALSTLLLLTILLSLCFIHVTPVSSDDGQSLMTLDVCSLNAGGIVGTASNIPEPFFEYPCYEPTRSFSERTVQFTPYLDIAVLEYPPEA